MNLCTPPLLTWDTICLIKWTILQGASLFTKSVNLQTNMRSHFQEVAMEKDCFGSWVEVKHQVPCEILKKKLFTSLSREMEPFSLWNETAGAVISAVCRRSTTISYA